MSVADSVGDPRWCGSEEAALRIVLTGTASDSHTWNLMYLQLVMEELGHEVTNLGACVADATLVERSGEILPDLVVVSSVNGHGQQDGLRVIKLLRTDPALAAVPVVIGGQLGVSGPDDAVASTLLSAGFDAVFGAEGDISRFRAFLADVPRLRTRSGS